MESFEVIVENTQVYSRIENICVSACERDIQRQRQRDRKRARQKQRVTMLLKILEYWMKLNEVQFLRAFVLFDTKAKLTSHYS